jgi:hypothetical protein
VFGGFSFAASVFFGTGALFSGFWIAPASVFDGCCATTFIFTTPGAAGISLVEIDVIGIWQCSVGVEFGASLGPTPQGLVFVLIVLEYELAFGAFKEIDFAVCCDIGTRGNADQDTRARRVSPPSASDQQSTVFFRKDA